MTHAPLSPGAEAMTEREIVEAMAGAMRRAWPVLGALASQADIYGRETVEDMARAALSALKSKGLKVMARPQPNDDLAKRSNVYSYWDAAPWWPGEGR